MIVQLQSGGDGLARAISECALDAVVGLTCAARDDLCQIQLGTALQGETLPVTRHVNTLRAGTELS